MNPIIEKEAYDLKNAYVIAPHWGGLFFVIGGAVLLIIGLSVWTLFGLSAASDQVFAIEALISGFSADIILKRFMRRKLLIAPKVGIPFMYIWPLLCLYVFIVHPFE